MRNLLQKLKDGKAGFSLAETLIAILILLMVSAIVAGAIPTASNVYAKTVDTANAQLLLSTTLTILRDELSTAADISKGDDGKTITYRSADNGYCKIEIVDTGDEPGIWITYLLYDKSVDNTKTPRPLVSSKASTSSEKTKMMVTYEIDSITDKSVKLKNIQVLRNGTAVPIASRKAFTIQRVANIHVTPTPKAE